jgi:hypothetical protein
VKDDVRLTRYQATKLWDRAFAASWPEVGPEHPARSAMEKLARFLGEREALNFITTGRIDVTIGMPSAPRYQQVAEEAPPNPQPDFEQSERMHRVAAQTAPMPGGGVVAGSF